MRGLMIISFLMALSAAFVEGFDDIAVDYVEPRSLWGQLQGGLVNQERVMIVSVDIIKTQEVAGVKYIFEITGQGERTWKIYKCHAEVLYKPWVVPIFQVLEYTCTKVPCPGCPENRGENYPGMGGLLERPVPCAGCPKNGDENDPRMRGLLERVVKSQNAKTYGEGITVVSIKSVKTQVVNGVQYTFKFDGKGKRSNMPYKCTTIFLNQPWIKAEPQVLQYTCKKSMIRT